MGGSRRYVVVRTSEHEDAADAGGALRAARLAGRGAQVLVLEGETVVGFNPPEVLLASAGEPGGPPLAPAVALSAGELARILAEPREVSRWAVVVTLATEEVARGLADWAADRHSVRLVQVRPGDEVVLRSAAGAPDVRVSPPTRGA